MAQVVNLPDDATILEVVLGVGLAVLFGSIPILLVLIPLMVSTRRKADSAASDAKSANEAVNHNPIGKDGKIPARLYDRVHENTEAIGYIVQSLDGLVEWKKKWDDMPDTMRNAAALSQLLGEHKGMIEELGRTIGRIQDRLQRHAESPHAHHEHTAQDNKTGRRRNS